MKFEPIIVGFLCNWCAYLAADQAGTMRVHYAPNLQIIRVMCSGRVEPQFVLKAFSQGADGVLIAGCHVGQCHYATGNITALCRYRLLQKVTSQFAMEPERLRFTAASASQGRVLAEAVNAMVCDLKNLGPAKGWNRSGIGSGHVDGGKG
jgi:F420-non-reducing hydrogenase iron-sulfur subunit